MILHHSQVTVLKRIREEIDEDGIDELISSLQSLGQLQPIVVTRSSENGFILVAGERRLICARRMEEKGKIIRGLEAGQVKAVLEDERPPHVQLQMEFDENVKRKDFTYVEKARFITKFHESMVAQAKEAGAEWTNVHTAAALRLAESTVGYYLRVEEAVKTDPNVAKAITLKAAVKRMKVVEKSTARQLEVKESAPESLLKAESILLLGNAMELIKAVPDNSIDAINFDPQWGDDVGHKSNDNWDGFDDSTESSDEIINTLLPELYRVLKNDRIMIYWYRTWAYADMIGRLEGAGFNLKFSRTPNIWFKPDKVSDQNRYPEKQLIDAYENFFFARKGDPILHVQGLPNVFPYNRVPKAALIHPTEKPLDLCKQLLSLVSIPGEKILDPTAGSAAFLHAALIGGRKPLGFELSTSIHARAATRLAEYIRSVKLTV